MARFGLFDCEWELIRPLRPNKPRGFARVDDPRVLNGISWVLGTGSPWRGLPVAITLSPGQAADKAAVENLLALHPRPGDDIADRGHDARAVLDLIAA
jgi:transposase